MKKPAPAKSGAVRVAGTDAEIRACYPVMRELRPNLTSAADLVARVRRQMIEGYQLAYIAEKGKPVACAGFRVVEMIHRGRSIYLDDLITMPGLRSKGHGRKLMRWLEAYGRRHGCERLHLDSGTQRNAAHRFYLRERFDITAYHFAKGL